MKIFNFIKNLNEHDDQKYHKDNRDFWWNDIPNEMDALQDEIIPTVQSEKGGTIHSERKNYAAQKKYTNLVLAKKSIHDTISERVVDLRGHNNSIMALCTSQRKDKLVELYSGGADCNIMVWDLIRGYIKCTLKGHSGAVHSLSYSSKLNMLASGSADSTIRIWNLDNYDYFNTITSQAGPVLSVIYSKNQDKIIATCSEMICIWQLPNNELVMTLNNEKHVDIFSLVISNGDNLLFSGHEAHFIRIWRLDVNDGNLVDTMYGHSGGVTALAMNYSNTHLISASKDKTVRVWIIRYLECIRNLNEVDYKVEGECIRTLQDSDFGLDCLVLSPKEDFFYVSGADNIIRKYTFNSDFGLVSSLKGHSNEVYALSFDYNSEILFSGSLDNTIKGWSHQDGSMAINFEGHSDSIQVVKMDHKEEFMVSGGSDCSIKLWDLDKKRCEKILLDHTKGINDLVIPRNREKLYSCSNDTTIKVWKLKDDFRCMHTLYDHREPVRCLALSNKGGLLYSGSDDRTIKIWDTNDIRVLASLEEHEKGVTAIALSTNDKYLYSGSEDAKIMIWMIRDRALIDTLSGHQGAIRRLIVSSGKYSLYSCSQDKTIKAWSIEERLCKITLKGHKKDVTDISLDKNQKYLYSSSDDTTIKIWDIESGGCINTFFRHEDSVTSIYRMRRSERFITGSKDRSIKIWDTTVPENSLDGKGHSGAITSISLTKNNDYSYLVSTSEDKTIRFWDPNMMICIKTITENSAVHCGVIDKDDNTFFSGNAECTLNLYRIEDQLIDAKYGVGTEPVSCIAIAESSEHIFTGYKRASSAIRVTSRINGDLIRELIGHKSAVTALACDWNDEYLYSGSSDRDILVWNLQTLCVDYTLKGHSEQINSICVDPRNLYIFSGSSDKTIKVWTRKDFTLVVTLNGHDHSVTSLVISHTGNILFSGSLDCTIKIWKTDDFKQIMTLEGHTGGIRSLAINNNSKILYSAGEDATIRVWNFNTLKSMKELDLYSLESVSNYMMSETYQEKEKSLLDLIFCLKFSSNPYYVHRINPIMFLTTLNYSKVLSYALDVFGYPALVVDMEDDLFFRTLKDDDKKHMHLDTLCGFLINRPEEIVVHGALMDLLIGDTNLKVQKMLPKMFCQDVEPQQGSFLDRKGKLRREPICVSTESTKYICSYQQSQVNKRGRNTESIDYLITKFSIDLRNGSTCSRDFFRGMDEDNREIVMSDFRHLINYKWKLLRPLITLHAIGFWLLILIMILHIIVNQKSLVLLVLCIIFNIIYVAYELICSWGEFWSHLFRDMNFLDLFCLGFNFFTLIVIWVSPEQPTTLKQIVIVLDIIFFFFRGITYLRIFKQTRYLISMILRVYLDIIAFMLVLGLFVLGLGMIALQLSFLRDDDKKLTFLKAIEICYLLALGDFDSWDTKTEPYDFVEFIIFTIILTLVMLNLLIAIISNAYEEVKQERDYFDLKEKLGIISDFENFLHKLMRRKSHPEHYKYQIIGYYPTQSSEQEMIKQLILQVTSLEHNLVNRMRAIEDKTDVMYQLLRVSRKSE